MHRINVGNHGHIRFYERNQFFNLALGTHSHLNHGIIRAHIHFAQRNRHTYLIIVIAAGGKNPAELRQHKLELFFCRRFTCAPRQSDNYPLETRTVIGSD